MKLIKFVKWYIAKLISAYTISHHMLISGLAILIIALVPFADVHTRAVMVVILIWQMVIGVMWLWIKMFIEHLKQKYAEFEDS